MRRRVWRAAAALVLLGACGGGGGGGDEDAFCDALEDLSDQVADGDLADDDGLDDVRDTLDELAESAGDDVADDVADLVEAADDAEPEDADDLADDIADDLGNAADDVCGIDEDEFAVAPEATTTTTTTTVEATTTTAVDEGTTATTAGGGDVPEGINPIGARQPVPADIEPEFAAAAQACFDGDMASCDALFFEQAPEGSVASDYSSSCAGRILEFANEEFECVANMFPPIDLSIELLREDLQPLLQACRDRTMQACDELQAATGDDDSFEDLFGDLCGGRLNNNVGVRVASCVEIFGEQAFA